MHKFGWRTRQFLQNGSVDTNLHYIFLKEKNIYSFNFEVTMIKYELKVSQSKAAATLTLWHTTILTLRLGLLEPWTQLTV